MGKSTISMVIFNSYVKLPEGSFGTKEAIAELEMEML
jgi:DNA-directed RNA polymerase specialized sigma54-like protein